MTHYNLNSRFSTNYSIANVKSENNSPSISVYDRISCNLISNGRLVLTFTLTGISNISDIYRYLKDNFGSLKGIITLTMRNITQGWINTRSLCFR